MFWLADVPHARRTGIESRVVPAIVRYPCIRRDRDLYVVSDTAGAPILCCFDVINVDRCLRALADLILILN